MVWTDYFNSTPSPSTFDGTVTLEILNGYQGSQLDDFINKVVSTLNAEAQKFNPTSVYDLTSIRSMSPSNWDSLTNIEKFNLVATTGKTILNQERSNTLTADKINSFYKKYFFRAPTQAEIDAAVANPYGLGEIVKPELKEQAINYLASYGVVKASEYERLTPEERVAKLEGLVNDISKIRETALQINNNLIDEDKVELSPIDAIGALIQLKDNGIAKLNANNTYSYEAGKSVDNLATIDNQKWLTSYQLLEKSWRDSGSTQTFSEYLADQQAFRSESDRVSISSTSEYGNTIFNTLGSQLAEKIASQLGSPEAKLQEIQLKINKLKSDAYNQAFNQLNVYRSKEEQNKLINETVGNGLQELTQEITQDFGLKSDFFKVGGLNTSATYSWQKWFEDELAKRYDPTNASSKVSSILGDASSEDISIASGFIKDFMQQRFDSSKSLAEFTEYIAPGQTTPVLEKQAGTIWNQYSADNYRSLLGAITDPNSNLGNFWTLLKNNWAQGQSFDTNFYKNQQVTDSNGKTVSVESFWNGLKAIHDVALQKNTTDLSSTDFDASIYEATNTTTEEELQNKINEYRNWWNQSFAYGSDINNLDEFAKLHYNVYTKQLGSMEQLVQPADGTTLKVSDGSGFTTQDQAKIQAMAEKLAYEASQYLSQIQYGEFMSPEEYVQKMMGPNSIFEMFQGTSLDSSSELEMIKEFNAEFAGTLSSYAGEQIRNKIRELIANNKMPNQEELTVEYIERTKAQALATIENIIKNKSQSSAVIINNVQAPAPGESIVTWFKNLGLEIVPGSTWTQFKTQYGIPSSTTLEQWDKSSAALQTDTSGQTLSQAFWQQWAASNGVNMSVLNGKISMVVENPSAAWKTWSNNIINGVTKNDSGILEALKGASVNLKTDQLNKTWYSNTNSYTQVTDGWKKALRNPNAKVLSVSTSNIWQWAKENQTNPEEAWNEYKAQKQLTDRNFGKDAAGDDFSFREWAETVSSTEVDRFWKDTSPYWVNYLIGKGILDSSSTTSSIKVKSWSEWAASQNIDLSKYSASSTDSTLVPSAYLDIHYNTLGGKTKVDQAYLDTYFPEFKILEEQEQSNSLESQFDLSALGFDKISTSKDDLLGDFNTYDPFKAISGDFGFDITNPSSIDTYDSKNTQNISGDIQFNFDATSSYNKKKNTAFIMDFGDMGFDSFGGADFGF